MANRISDTTIILLFAFAHACASWVCRTFGLQDDIFLTILTMALTMIICERRGMSTMFIAIAILLINIFGFAFGFLFSELFELFFSDPLIINPLSTFFTTLVMGYSISGFAILYKKSRNEERSDKGLIWLLVAFVIAIMVRLILVLPVPELLSRKSSLNIVLNYALSILAFAIVVIYTVRVMRQKSEEQERAHLAQYRYMKLKQQFNPHFLFNSLSMLDCMIQEQSPQQASRYTHKLAEIYRYMISNEDQTLVPLREEMDFVGKYVSLLKVRFPDGLDVRVDIDDDALNRNVVPCCIQLLIENATKHNAVRKDNPLIVRIFVEDDMICVVNNLSPKIGRPSSTGLGLKYIRQQYKDLSGKDIFVEKSDNEFIAKLPLL